MLWGSSKSKYRNPKQARNPNAQIGVSPLGFGALDLFRISIFGFRISHRRAGFTLVELLVAMGIIVLLTGLLVAMLPSLASQTAEANGAANLQGWLNVARQKAIRNQSPFGLRLFIPDVTTMYVTNCQYIEQPDDFASGSTPNGGGAPVAQVQVTTATTLVANDTINFAPAIAGGQNVDLTGGFGIGSDPSLWPVQLGDFVEINSSGLMHRITAIPTPIQLVLATGTPNPIGTGTTNWRILRAPRPIGEEQLALPTGVIVDLSAATSGYGFVPPLFSLTNNGVVVGGYADVLFSPSGSVITPGAPQQAFTALWVRQPDTSPNGNPNNPFAGTPTVIAVFQGTGLVAAYPPVSTAPSPYVDIH